MLSLLAKEFFQQSPVLGLPVMALLIFFGVFVAAVVRVMRTPSAEIDALAQMPLKEGSHE
ncbi:MAG: hypothetical protein R3A78_10985 [Polyangiales bacterium]|nr:hypothetical protein [Myxococcales bacterium]